jgi:hypothetical protein
MTSFGSNYHPADYQSGGIDLVEDDYKVRIEKVEETQSKKGQPMLIVELAIAQASITFRHYIVENEYFDGNMTKFFDCFGIPRGNFELERWKGRVGKAHIAKGKPRDTDGKSFWEVAYLIAEKQAPRLSPAPFPQQPPQPVKVNFAERPAPDGFADEIPF